MPNITDEERMEAYRQTIKGELTPEEAVFLANRTPEERQESLQNLLEQTLSIRKG